MSAPLCLEESKGTNRSFMEKEQKLYSVVFSMVNDRGSRGYYNRVSSSFSRGLERWMKEKKELGFDDPSYYVRARVVRGNDGHFRLEFAVQIDYLEEDWVVDGWNDYLHPFSIDDYGLCEFEEVFSGIGIHNICPKFIKNKASKKYFPIFEYGETKTQENYQKCA